MIMHKIIKFSAMLIFSACAILLLGSMPIPKSVTPETYSTELEKLNKSISSSLDINISAIQQKNPSIFLEISVE